MMLKNKYCRISINAFALLVVALTGCGDAPSELPIPVENAGLIIISGSIQAAPDETITPDSIGIILAGEDLGYNSNPFTINDVLTGFYPILVYFSLESKTIHGSVVYTTVRFNEVSEVNVELKTGTIVVLSEIEITSDNSVTPETIGIILDGDSLGVRLNPDTLTYIPEGVHQISTYGLYDGKNYLGPERDVDVLFNQITDVNYSMFAGGILVINAGYDGQPLTEFGLKLDGNDLGVDVSPRILPNVDEGLHKLVVWTTVDEIDYEGWQCNIEVTLAETTRVDFEMQVVAPDSGFHAPDIDCIDIDGNSHSLSDHWGEVVYLYFFEYT
ncbi:MAG: hypothetical protein P9X24_06325 [Candidatus Hatepunaea meridiana]|nr:hypothetical protein [Candidatus Hatepunaea meridiana]